MSTTAGSSSIPRILPVGAFRITANNLHSLEMPHFLTVTACSLVEASWATLVAPCAKAGATPPYTLLHFRLRDLRRLHADHEEHVGLETPAGLHAELLDRVGDG